MALKRKPPPGNVRRVAPISNNLRPDFIVWKTTGEVEIHEVTLTSRQNRESIQEREKAARDICQQRGWSYVVHTEKTLPGATEEANLLALYRYRPTISHHPAVTPPLHTRLSTLQ